VDDIVLIGNYLKVMNNITSLLHEHFGIKNLGDLTYFIGLEVARNNTSILSWLEKIHSEPS